MKSSSKAIRDISLFAFWWKRENDISLWATFHWTAFPWTLYVFYSPPLPGLHSFGFPHKIMILPISRYTLHLSVSLSLHSVLFILLCIHASTGYLSTLTFIKTPGTMQWIAPSLSNKKGGTCIGENQYFDTASPAERERERHVLQ